MQLLTFILYRNYAALGNFFSLMPTLITFLNPKSKTLPPVFCSSLLIWNSSRLSSIRLYYGRKKEQGARGWDACCAYLSRAQFSLTPITSKRLLRRLEKQLSYSHFSVLLKEKNRCLFSYSTKELFLKFLKRLEEDYNPKEYEGNLIKDVSTKNPFL